MVCDVIDRDTSVGISVIGLRDGAESFLSCRVPHLDLCDLIVDVESLHFEVDTNCVLVSLVKTVFNEPHQKRSFTAVACADKDDFNKSRIRFPTCRKAVVCLTKFGTSRVAGNSLANNSSLTLCTDKRAPTEGMYVMTCGKNILPPV